MAGRYAQATEVSSDRSRAEIEKTLIRYGASGFAYAWKGLSALIEFELKDRRYRFVLPLPDRNSDEIKYTPARQYYRSEAQQSAAYEQAVRSKWRALGLVIKAKLEAVEAGISTVEEEFTSAVVLPNGRTVGEWIKPQIAEAYATGTMPAMMPGLQSPSNIRSLPAGRTGS